MLKLDLQMFGGRGSTAGGGGGGSSALANRLDRTPFVDEGGGQWTLDTGMGGAQILDETGGTRDPFMGFGGKVYSVHSWDSDYNTLLDGDIFNSLNEAKRAAKQSIKDTL